MRAAEAKVLGLLGRRPLGLVERAENEADAGA